MSGPALAVIGSDGQLQRSTAAFGAIGAADALLGEASPELEQVLRGELRSAVLSTPELTATVEAVVDASGAPRALVTVETATTAAVGDERSPNPLLDEHFDASPAIVFLKDLEGRYLRVNATHGALLGTGEDEVRGRTDVELARTGTVDGPRLSDDDTVGFGPNPLEYVVPGLDGRPALSVLRFPVHDRDGAPVAVCGVAAPLERAEVARQEAERLIELERLAHLDPAQARRAVMEEWGLARGAPRASPPNGKASDPASEGTWSGEVSAQLSLDGEDVAESAAVGPAGVGSEVVAEQAAEIARLREAIMLARAEAEQAHVAAGREHEEATAQRTAAQAARAEAAEGLVRIERLEADAAQLASRLEQADAQARDWRAQAEAAVQETRTLAVEAGEAGALVAELRERLAAAEARRDGHADEVMRHREVTASATARADELREALAQAHARLAELSGQLDALQGRFEAQLEGARQEAEARVQAARSEAQERVRSVQAEAQQQVQAARAEAQEQVQAARAEAQERLRHAAQQSQGDAPGPAYQALLDELRERIAALEEERRQAAARLEHADETAGALRETAGELREAAAAQSGRVDELRRALEEAQQRLSQTASELEAARTREAAGRELVEQARRQLAAQQDATEQGSDHSVLQAALDVEAARAEELRQSLHAAQEQLVASTEATTAARTRLEAEVERLQGQLADHRTQAAAALDAERERAAAELATALDRASQDHETERARMAQNLETVRDSLTSELADARSAVDELQADRDRRDRVQADRRAAFAAGEQEGALGPRWHAGAMHLLASVLGDAEGLRAGLSSAVEIIGAQGRWDSVAAWMPDPRGLLRCGGAWSTGPYAALSRQAMTGEWPAQPSGLGSALYSRDPLWLTANASTARGARLDEAFAQGIGTAVLLPIRDGVARIGVLELLSEAEMDADEDLIRAMAAVGLQLGQFLALVRARPLAA